MQQGYLLVLLYAIFLFSTNLFLLKIEKSTQITGLLQYTQTSSKININKVLLMISLTLISTLSIFFFSATIATDAVIEMLFGSIKQKKSNGKEKSNGKDTDKDTKTTSSASKSGKKKSTNNQAIIDENGCILKTSNNCANAHSFMLYSGIIALILVIILLFIIIYYKYKSK